jgi:phosphotransferase system enzyme I (PtsI)
VLQLIARTIEIANQAGKHVSVCGEMAGDAAFTELLLAMGLRSFSMHPSQIASVKQRILRAEVKRLGPRLSRTLLSDEPMQAWAGAPDPREAARDIGLDAP